MSYYWNLCDKSIMDKSKYNHLKSISHKMLSEYNLRRYIIQNPKIIDIDEIMRKQIVIYNKKLERYSVSCVLKLLTATNCVRYMRINTRLNLGYIFNLSKNSILFRTNRDRY